jgi:hypothetical protein
MIRAATWRPARVATRRSSQAGSERSPASASIALAPRSFSAAAPSRSALISQSSSGQPAWLINRAAAAPMP